jgi:putative transposase
MLEMLQLLNCILPNLSRDRQSLVVENLLLRHQLTVALRSRQRPKLRTRDRLFWVWARRLCPSWRQHLVLVSPATVTRWHRQGWRLFWTWRSRHPGGRPRLSAEVRDLIALMSRDNPLWGTERIRGELLKLGIAVSNRSIRRYRPRGPVRPPSQTWRTFLTNHRPQIWAADLFTVPTLTFRTLSVLVVIAHDRRQLVHVNVTAHPTAAWIWQQFIQATPWSTQPKYLIRDRDRAYGPGFAGRARALGTQTLLAPIRAPRANAVAERVIGTLRRECLDHLVVLNEQHLRAILREFVAYYNADRPHRTLGLEPPEPAPHAQTGPVRSRRILGGLHHVYERAA